MAQNESATDGNISKLATAKIGKLLWEYSIPAVVGMLVVSLYNVVDRIFIGHGVGTEAIAGLAITFPVMNVSSAIGMLIGAGASARVSIMLGAKNIGEAERVLGNALVLIVINAIIYITLFAVFLDDILLAFGASAASLPYAHNFMIWILPGMLITNVSFSFNNIMRSSGYPVKAMITMFIGAGANIILDPIFIFALDMGIQGAAIATDIAMLMSATFVMLHFCQRKSNLHFKKHIFGLRLKIIIGIIGIGAAPCLVNLAGSAINIIINRELLHYGSDNAVAAAGIFTTYTSLLVLIVVGICQGLQPIIGYNYGAGLFDRLKRAYRLAVMCGTAICSAGAAFGLMFPQLIAKAFTTDTMLISQTVSALSIALLAFWVVGFQVVSTTLFQSLGKAGKSIFLSLIRQVIFLIPLLLLLPRSYHLNGVWASFPLSDTLATVVTVSMVWWQFNHLKKSQMTLSNEAK